MIKRLLSKRSGFTLVEIIVAFAVFAIMAVMICQILMMVMNQRQSNKKFADEIAQDEKIIAADRNYDIDSDAGFDEMNFTFYDDGSSVSGVQISMKYQTKEADGSVGAEGLNYFVTENENKDHSVIDGGGNDSDDSGLAQVGRTDTRITGSRGFKQIWVTEVIKDTTYKGEGCRYFFTVYATANKDSDDYPKMQDDDEKYAQYVLYFYDDVKLDTEKMSSSSNLFTEENDTTKKYRKKIYKAGVITSGGYIDMNASEMVAKLSTETEADNAKTLQERGLARDFTPFQSNDNNKYRVSYFDNGNYVRIGSPIGSGTSTVPFLAGKSSFYLVFDDPGFTITTASFGYNGHAYSGNGTEYNLSPSYKDHYSSEEVTIEKDKDNNDKYHLNIYGSFPFEKIPDVSESEGG